MIIALFLEELCRDLEFYKFHFLKVRIPNTQSILGTFEIYKKNIYLAGEAEF